MEVEAVIEDKIGEAPVVESPVVEKVESDAPEKEASPISENIKEKLADSAEKKEGESELPAPYVPNFKFKAGVYDKSTKKMEQKEYEIDPKLHGLIKDKETEELVRSIYAKGHGIDSIKERYNEAQEQAMQVAQENTEIKESIDGLRNIYQSAVRTGNLHKLDGFFEQLKIPQDVVMAYALEKAKLQEMDPAQRQIVQEKINAERRAEELVQQQSALSQQNFSHAQQIKRMQFENVMGKPEVHSLASAFDERLGKPGSFAAAVQRVGELAWYQRKEDLTPEQAVNEVIEQYNLRGIPLMPAAPQGQAAAAVLPPGQKPVVQRETKTIPNLQSRGQASPLKQKPRSIDDLKALSKQMSSGQ